MRAEKIHIAPRGWFEMRVRVCGRVVEDVSGPNLVVNGSREAIVRALGGDPDARIVQLAVGTNGTAPNDVDSSLADAVLTQLGQPQFLGGGKVAFPWQVGTAQANGLQIREFGLVTAGGLLVARKTRVAAIDKTPAVSLEGVWTLYL